ncbi:DNA polymerase [Brachionus plicatilis]|uniref:DNA polymerase n=1 Tax=Brachionus plicatilis TaxID=10195 RepID=A0A3M7RM74_BRAPC|nr:DNA polymerase [Brachionus plicatilis]
MKFFILSIILGFTLISVLDTKTVKHDHESHKEKRFLGSVTSWINNNIIDPVTSGVNNVVNAISDPLASFGNQLQGIAGSMDNFFSNTLVDAVNTAFDKIKDQSISIYHMAVDFFFPTGENGSVLGDPCNTVCFQRINYQNKLVDYFFDRPNGCISKGFIDPSVNVFNSCCDQHNYCLNEKCCTNNCQTLKNDCDTKYNNCLKQKCTEFIFDDVQFYTCLARASYIASSAVNRTCSTTINQNRKICYC